MVKFVVEIDLPVKAIRDWWYQNEDDYPDGDSLGDLDVAEVVEIYEQSKDPECDMELAKVVVDTDEEKELVADWKEDEPEADEEEEDENEEEDEE